MYIPRHWSTPLPTASLLCSVPQTCPQPAPWSLPDSKNCSSWQLTPPRQGWSVMLKHQGSHCTKQKAAANSFLSPTALDHSLQRVHPAGRRPVRFMGAARHHPEILRWSPARAEVTQWHGARKGKSGLVVHSAHWPVCSPSGEHSVFR